MTKGSIAGVLRRSTVQYGTMRYSASRQTNHFDQFD